MKMKRFVGYFLGTFILLLGMTAYAAKNFHVRNYTIADGLPASKVSCVLQDTRGFVWFATQDGLSRFDGREFINYTVEHGLPDNRLKALMEDSNGRLWIGTVNHGVGYFSGAVLRDFHIVEGCAGAEIETLHEDRNGYIWMGSTNGAVRFDGGRMEAAAFQGGQGAPHVYSLLEDSSGAFWFGTNHGLYRSAPGTPLSPVPVQIRGLTSVTAICEKKSGGLALGAENGLLIIDPDNPAAPPRLLLEGRRITRLSNDSDGNLWVGSETGAVVLSEDEAVALSIQTVGLIDDHILSITEDADGSHWLGTSVGAGYLTHSIFRNYTVQQGLAHNMAWSFAEDAGGDIWIGTMDGAARFSNGRFVNYTAADSPLTGPVYSVFHDGRGRMWFGLRDGTAVYDGKRWLKYGAADGFASVRVNRIMESRGMMWFATADGLYRFNLQTAAFTHYRLGDTPNRNNVKSIVGAGAGRLLVLTIAGAGYFENGAFTPHPYPGLRGKPVWAFTEDSRGTRWFGTRYGLYRERNGTFTHYTVKNGLSNDVVYFIAEGNDGYMWIGTNRGLNRFDGEHFKQYSKDNGMISSETNINAMLKDSTGKIWIGTPHGVTVLSESESGGVSLPTPIHLTSVSVLTEPIAFDRPRRLKHHENFLRFEFTGISFPSPASVRYRYRLKGTGVDWQEIAERGVSYPSLTPGDYLFEVEARSHRGSWSREPARFSFTITPPFHHTWWFRIFVLFLLMGIVYYYFKRKTRTIRRQMNRETEQKLEVQRVQLDKEKLENDMKMKADFTAMLVHDLRSPLTAVMGFSDLLREGSDGLDIPRIGTVISGSCAKMLGLINDMLNLSKFEAGKMNLNKTAASLTETARDIADIMEPLLTVRELSLDLQFRDDVTLLMDGEKIGQVIGNFISNAVKFSPDKGVITITVQRVVREEKGFLELSVTDQGPGIPEKKQEYLFDKYSQLHEDKAIKGTGLGLAVSRLIVEAHGGQIGFRPAEPSGSVFYFTLPLTAEGI